MDTMVRAYGSKNRAKDPMEQTFGSMSRATDPMGRKAISNRFYGTSNEYNGPIYRLQRKCNRFNGPVQWTVQEGYLLHSSVGAALTCYHATDLMEHATDSMDRPIGTKERNTNRSGQLFEPINGSYGSKMPYTTALMDQETVPMKLLPTQQNTQMIQVTKQQICNEAVANF